MPSFLNRKSLKKVWESIIQSRQARFVAYVLILFYVSMRLSDYGNIDLMSYWQEGHWGMLALSLPPTALLVHSFCLLRRWGVVPLFLWLVFMGAQVYVLRAMNFRISFGIISNIFETNIQEASPFLSWQVILGMGLALAGSFIFIFGMNWLKNGERRKYGVLWLVLLAGTAVNFAFVPNVSNARGTALWPFRNMVEMTDLFTSYWFQERPLMQSLGNLPSTAEPDSSFSSIPGGVNVVFHFGETGRADHWSLNGYGRETTPFAESAAREGRLINFPRTLSYAAGTRLGAVGLLTPARLDRKFPEYGPFFDLYEKHGFDLRAFRSNQQADDQVFDSTLIVFSRLFKNRTTYNAGTADELLPDIGKYLEETQNPNRMIFYYGEGSHAPYCYNSRFARFLPDDMDTRHYGRTPKEAVNRYDNSIYATDQFIASVTEKLKGACSVYIYTADHGEYLGEHGRYSHGINTMCDPEIRWVPMFVWVSPEFERKCPEKVAQLRKNAASFPVVSHDYIFHTILGLSCISSPVYEARWDLSSPQALPYTGQMPEDISPSYVFDSLQGE